MTDADELTTLAGQGIVSIGEAADGLAAQLKALQEAGLMDREAYREAIVRLVNTWSQTSDFMGARAQAAEAGMVLRYLPPGASNNDIDAIYPGAAMLTTGGGNAEAVLTTVDLEQQARVAEFRETIARIEYLVHVLEPMNAVPFVDVTVKDGEPAIVTGAGTKIFAVAATPPVQDRPEGGFLVTVTIPPAYVPISQAQLNLLEQSHAALPDEAANDGEFAGYSAMRRGAA